MSQPSASGNASTYHQHCCMCVAAVAARTRHLSKLAVVTIASKARLAELESLRSAGAADLQADSRFHARAAGDACCSSACSRSKREAVYRLCCCAKQSTCPLDERGRDFDYCGVTWCRDALAMQNHHSFLSIF